MFCTFLRSQAPSILFRHTFVPVVLPSSRLLSLTSTVRAMSSSHETGKKRSLSSSSSSSSSSPKAKRAKLEDSEPLSETLKGTEKKHVAPVSVLTDEEFDEKNSELPPVDERRVKTLLAPAITKTKGSSSKVKGVVYWMSREQRAEHNWALLYARQLAIEHRAPLHVAFCLVPGFLGATIRHYRFMLKGLKEVEEQLESLGIPFHLLIGHGVEKLPEWMENNDVNCCVLDFSPLRVPRKWTSDLLDHLKTKQSSDPSLRLFQVDAHNVVPVWEASDHQEVAARTIRSKIQKKLGDFLTDFPQLPVFHSPLSTGPRDPIDWEQIEASLTVDQTVGDVVPLIAPGPRAAHAQLERFLKQLSLYQEKRNDPSVPNVLSGLSPYFHFGQISPQYCILQARKHKAKFPRTAEGAAGFEEEALIRRELSDNFCFYNPNYDNLQGAAQWARLSLAEHETDQRDYIYTYEEFERGETHDELWNAAQLQMVREGKMHGFMRMYWAKKILEWTRNATEALDIAIRLNDRFELDGRDPNGYVGCAWSIMGIHDQGWKERAIFGKVRYMNYAGCQRKFDINAYIRRYPSSTRASGPARTRATSSSSSSSSSVSSKAK